MTAALEQARLAPQEIAHLNAHATSTSFGDLSGVAAVADVFGRRGDIAISATKSSTGHLLGAAGGLEAIFAILAWRDQVAPPTRNLQNPDPAADGLDIVGAVARHMRMDYAMTNGFGFGGVTATAIFRRW